MNKIFKVIWSKSKQCYVVVSELAKNTTGKKKIVVAGIFSALAIVQFGQVAQVQADGAIGSSTHKGSLAINGTWKAGYSNAKATDENAIAIGQDAQATGRGGVALGNETRSVQNALAAAWDAQATSKNAVALGTGTRAMGLSSTAVGAGSQATSNNSVAVGTGTRATGLSSTAVGDGAQATANGAVALGQATESAGNSVAAGFNAKARSNNTVAIGVEANNDGSITNNASSVSVGVATRARAVGSMAMGVSADASGKYSLALGSGDVGTDYTAGTNYPSASGEKSIAIGYNSNAGDLNALAIGTGASVNKQNATAVGSGASVTGHNATAVGNDTKAIKQYDNAFGYTSTASGGAATAVGYLATASGNQTVALGSTINSTAQYATGIGYSVNSQGEGSVAIGAGTDALGAIPAKQVKATAKNAIAIGRATQATSQDATAIGTEATASNTDAIAIGRKSNASGSTSIGFGYNTKASDTNTVAIGTDVSATAESAIALGRKTTASGLSSTAVGPIANASGKYSSAFGMSATTSEENALALGTSANATRKNSVSLGSNSSTVNAATSESSVTFGNKNITWTAGVLSGTNLDGMQVSVGATGAERQIKNVAAGKISATSTDAINGAQLYAVAEGLRTKYVSINSTISNNQNNDGATGSDSVAIGPDAAATKPDSVAMGRSVKANGQQSIAVGKSAEAKQDYNVAIGSEVVANGNNSVAMGRYASSTGTAALAIGAYGNNKSTASGNYSIAIGRDVTASGVDSIATGRDSKATAEKALAYGANAQALATNSIAIGADSQANVDKGIAIGAGSKANVASGVAGYNPNTEIIVRTDTYAPTAANTWSGTWGAVSVGDGTNTRQITGVAAGKADTDAVNVAQLKSVNLAFTGNSGSGDVNLSKSKLAVEGGTNSFITTTAANKKLEINTTQGTLKNTSGTVSVNGANGLAVAQNVADVINQANADQTIKYKANGTGNNSVKLSDGLNFTNGITTTATVGANGQVTFDLNTATQKSITDSATAVARTISLGGDTGITTAKSLSSANVNFGIKSGSPTYLTTVANGNDVTLTINEQAIKNAAKDASSFKVKANSTAAEDVKGGDTVVFNNGDNIAITQTGKTFKIATAPNVKFDTAIIGTNTTIGSTGITTNKVTVGNVSIDGTNGINAGNKAITNVGTGIVANSNADNSNVANIGDVKTIANDAVANLSTSLGVTDGTNSGTVNLKNQSLKVVGTGVAKATVSGQTITVDVAKGTLTNNTTTGALTGTAGVVDANDMAAAVNTAITKAVDTATGTQKLDISAGGTDSSVNLKNQKLTVAGTGAATASLNNQTITVDVAQGTFTNKSDGTTSATAGVAKATDVAAAINNTNT
ncbi:MAG: ESPR-type extended signal peptide-containing protein, partial [Veillonella sp.]|nr:ESPR-type extended signal peptide-containing protein [Veillonella sp.]